MVPYMQKGDHLEDGMEHAYVYCINYGKNDMN